MKCKFIDMQGNVIGTRDVPLNFGVAHYKGIWFGRMANGDGDRKRYPFIFAQSDAFPVETMEEYHERRKPRQGSGAKPARTGNHVDRRSGVLRQRGDKPEADRRRPRSKK